ncbi:MAG: squalene/phytoene synthase family protein [Pseudomonadota bacterium]
MTVTDLSPDPAPAGVSPQEVVDRITGAAKSSFSLGMKLLSRPRREAMRAVYAFCRVVDDIADGDLSPEEKRRMLADWRAEVNALYAGAPGSAVGQALMRPVADYDLPKAEFLAMIEGMEMDAAGPVVAPSDAELARYTRCVAGSVGLLSMRIFGAWRGEASERFALALADALQLTNILRDVEEDAAIGRLYLPREVLERHGIATTPDKITGADGLPVACLDIGARARANFLAARAEIPAHSRLALVPAMAMLGVYEGYLDRMEAEDFRRFDLTMSSGEKLRRGLWAAAFAGPV